MYRFDGREVVPLLATAANERYPELSPDGRWLAYVSDENGRDEVLVILPDRKRTLVVSREGAHSPAWARDGKTLYFQPLADWPGQLLGVSVSGGDALTLGPQKVVFRLPQWTGWNAPVSGYDIRPDGQRFLFARLKKDPAPPRPVTQLQIVQNWFAELERLSPTGR